MKKRKTAYRFSIKSKIMTMVLIATVVPLCCLIFFSRFYQQEIIVQKRNNELETQIKYALGLSQQRFAMAIKLSKDITYEENIEECATLLQKNIISKSAAYKYITVALRDKFYLNNDILFTAVLLDTNPDQIYTATADGYHEVDKYLKSVHPFIEEKTKNLGSKVCIFVADNSIYIIRNLISTKSFKEYGIIINQINMKTFFKELNENASCQQWTELNINDQPLQLINIFDEEAELTNSDLITFQASIKEEQIDLSCKVKVNKNELIQEETIFVKGITISVFIIILGILVVLILMYRSIVKPIVKLTVALKEVEEGNWGVTINTSRDDELGVMVKGFNDMSLKVQYLIDCVYQEELNLKEAKIEALQAQINPHFINNTLEIINWKVQMLGGNEISKMIRALSVILIATLNRNNEKMITLSEEIKYMDSYLYILKRRFEERITIEKEIDDKLLECKVPILIIQPLLENAVKHGIEPAKGGVVSIKIIQIDDKIVISIANNGTELTLKEEIEIEKMLSGYAKEEKRSSVGIRNVNERIKLIYGMEYGLTIGKNKQNMTESKIVIPWYCTINSNK